MLLKLAPAELETIFDSLASSAIRCHGTPLGYGAFDLYQRLLPIRARRRCKPRKGKK